MQNQNEPEEKRPRRKKSEPLKPILIIFALIILVIAGTGILFFTESDNRLDSLETETLNTDEDQTQDIDKNVQALTDESSTPENQDPGIVNLTEEVIQDNESATSDTVTESPEDKRTNECRILSEQVHGFFTHIDSEDYIKQFELQEPSQAYFIALTYKLLKNPPVVSRESDDLYTILKNMAHFFRVIGKDNIVLMKTILDRERDKIEDVMAELYQWTAWENCNNDMLQFSPSLEQMYEYAGFFLNTMGGRSYLFRRDSRSRLLVNYYSVLLIERANKEGLNQHGIDIALIIPQLVQEIDSSNQLIYKENYIDSLYNVLEQYE